MSSDKNKFQKGILLIGTDEMKKRLMSYRIIEFYEDNFEHIVQSPYCKFSPSMFNKCTPKTSLILFDRLFKKERITFFFSTIVNGLEIMKPFVQTFTIKPQIVIICDKRITRNDMLSYGLSGTLRFNIIDCDNESLSDNEIKELLNK